MLFTRVVIMKNFMILTMLFLANSINASMVSSSALKFLANAAYHTNDFQGAQAHYSKLLAKNPYDPETNYNLGLTSLKQMKHDQALNYFTRAAKHAQKNSQLQEQAFFNQGNTLVGINKLQESLESYQQVLAINQKNDRAKQNIEIVKKMLEQQKQQNDDKKDQNQDQKKDQNKNDNQNQKSDKKNEKNDDSKDQDFKDQNSEKLDDKKEQEKTKQEKEKEEQNKKDRDQKDQSSDQNQTKEQSADQLEKSKQQKEKQDDSLKKSQEKQENSNNSDQKEQHQAPQEESLKDELAELVNPDDKDDRLNKTSANLMQKMKDHEDHIQKQLLKMNVSKHGAAKHGQKNW
jgi:Ca-activated chloride channel family protein